MDYPEYYEAYIGTGQLVDFDENEIAFKEAASEWVENDTEGLALRQPVILRFEKFLYSRHRNLLLRRII